jgi:hypothetical protein
MKTFKLSAILILALLLGGNVSAQTADEIIGKYLDAIGGKDKLNHITSLYMESTLDVMGMQGNMKMTTLNGKGMRQDIDIAGSVISSCFTDKEGWAVNPMAGSTTAETMPEAQYNAGKDQIYIGGPFINLAEKGSKAEFLGNETVANVNAFKIKVTKPDSTSSIFYFDPATSLLIQAVTMSEMQGQMVDNVMTYSDYKMADGYNVPYKYEMNMAGGQVSMLMQVTKVELNKPVDETIFAKPQ